MSAPSLLPYLFQDDLYSFGSPIVVVLSQPWDVYSPDEHVLLQKILASVKVDINAVQVVSRPSLPLEALQSCQPDKVLIFGSDIEPDVPLYSETTANGFRVVRADDLRNLDDQKKKSLWTALRQMFGV